METQVKINIIVKIFKEGDYYIAYSPQLQIATQGHNQKEAQKRFNERVQIFLERGIETGTLHKRLKTNV